MTKSEQARADALADAETLRAPSIAMARYHGWNAVSSLASQRAEIDAIYREAVLAARAAFRAVPGLRGDR